MVKTVSPVANAELTRGRILKSAFEEFYQHGFQGGSLNRIVESARITKGALFHHFRSKHDLGYHVVDEVIRPYIQGRWVGPLLHSREPVNDIKRIVLVALQGEPEMLCRGCPLNNLAQEMSSLDEEFRRRVNAIYEDWRVAVEQALRAGIEHGTVRDGVSPKSVAAFIVAALAGMVGTAKNAQSLELLQGSAQALFDYLETLRP